MTHYIVTKTGVLKASVCVEAEDLHDAFSKVKGKTLLHIHHNGACEVEVEDRSLSAEVVEDCECCDDECDAECCTEEGK